MAGIIKGSINLSNIPKDKIIQGKKGKYIPISITVNDEEDQFGNFGPTRSETMVSDTAVAVMVRPHMRAMLRSRKK